MSLYRFRAKQDRLVRVLPVFLRPMVSQTHAKMTYNHRIRDRHLAVMAFSLQG
jgi:hypothetical protein